MRTVKEVEQVELLAMPVWAGACFELLADVDPQAPAALFGGAVRDADYAAAHGQVRLVKDYDLRVLLPEDDYDERKRAFVARLGEVAQTEIREVPSAGTGIMRQCLMFADVELDISIRPQTFDVPVALERVQESDIGLSSVAIGSDGIAWAAAEYLGDRDNKMLSVYWRDNPERLETYARRMHEKFPDHQIVWLSPPGS